MAMESAALTDQGTVPEAAARSPRGGGAVTLKEVATRAGVSQGVASTVLSGRSNNIRVGAETQSRVMEAAQALGYRSRRTPILPGESAEGRAAGVRPAVAAVALPQALSSISVGIITSFNPFSGPAAAGEGFDPWEHDIPAGLELALGEGARHVVTHYCNRGRRGELPLPIEEAIAQTLAIGVDALTLIDISSSAQVVGCSLPFLMATGRPFVVVSTDALSAPVANVFFDSANAGYLAARHLIEQGYREICFLSPMRAPWADERIDGAREALLHAGLPMDGLRVYPPEAERMTLPSFDARRGRWDHRASGREAGEHLLDAEGTPPLALIAANDGTAAGFLEAAEAKGFRAGVDFALMGFDDAPEARQYSLTTVRPPREAMGREAARLLLRLAAGDQTARVQIRLNSHLMTRRSTPPCAALTRNTPEDNADLPSLPDAAGGSHLSSKGVLK